MIPGLLRRVRVLEDEVNQARPKSRKLWLYITVAVFIVGWIMIGGDKMDRDGDL